MTNLFSIVAQRRGWTRDTIDTINKPITTEQIRDLNKAAELLHQIHENQDLIVVLPDFDMDGITSGTLGFAGLAELGFNTALYRPDAARGHGFTAYDIESIKEQWPAVKAIISCDTGIDAHEGISYAKQHGITVIVTDHHKEILREENSNGQRVPADVVVDPSRVDDPYPFKGVCGAYVLYRVLEQYTLTYARHKIEDITLLKLFAGIGTISDVMPLLYENRQMVKDSLALAKMLYVEPEYDENSGEIIRPDISKATLLNVLQYRPHAPVFIEAFTGMAHAIAEFAYRGKLRSVDDLDERFYSFLLAPAFNALRRMEGSMEDGFGAFFSQDHQARIKLVVDTNDQRKELTAQHMEDLKTSDQPFAPYVYLTDAIPGMLGLMAGQLMAESHLPTLVIHRETLNGSGRSPMWFDYNSFLNDHGIWAAGHEQAFGVQGGNLDNIQKLCDILNSELPKVLEQNQDVIEQQLQADLVLGYAPRCDADLEEPDDLLDLAYNLEKLKPYGHEFPLVEIDIVLPRNKYNVKCIGQEQQHLSITTHSGVKCLIWNKADQFEAINQASSITMTGRVEVNNFLGKVSPNIIVDTIKEIA